MAGTTTPSEAPTSVPRFDGTERALHWVNAALFGLLMVTGAVLYIGPLSALVGRRETVRLVHVLAGLILPLPLLVARFGPWRQAVTADMRALARFDGDDRRWLRHAVRARSRHAGRDETVRMGKFHPGQKLNAAFTAGAIAVMFLSGSIMHWFRFFPVDWRTGATFVHDWLAFTVAVVVAGHLRMALVDRDALRSMIKGSVRGEWARHHRPKWYEEVTGLQAPAGGDG